MTGDNKDGMREMGFDTCYRLRIFIQVAISYISYISCITAFDKTPPEKDLRIGEP
jgi:hypothetical protein